MRTLAQNLIDSLRKAHSMTRVLPAYTDQCLNDLEEIFKEIEDAHPDRKLKTKIATLQIRTKAYEKLLKSLDRESHANGITLAALRTRIKTLEAQNSPLVDSPTLST